MTRSAESHAGSPEAGTTTSRRPSAVVFDLGNVLIRWDPHPALAAGLGAEEASRLLSAEDFDFMAWNHLQDAGRAWRDAEDEVRRTHPHWHRHVLSYRENFDLSLLGALEDNVAVLRDLHTAGVPLYALTNWSAELFPRARERFEFLDLFEDIVVSGEERLAKPDPEIFAVLGRRTGLPLHECLFVDDSPANVAAAVAAGMPAVVFTEDRPLHPALRARGLPV
ncbi:MAG: HAD family hydrolase [Nocardioidaceae bacterium]